MAGMRGLRRGARYSSCRAGEGAGQSECPCVAMAGPEEPAMHILAFKGCAGGLAHLGDRRNVRCG
jgi:hypothetical protein